LRDLIVGEQRANALHFFGIGELAFFLFLMAAPISARVSRPLAFWRFGAYEISLWQGRGCGAVMGKNR
jgi:hypothetical protein